MRRVITLPASPVWVILQVDGLKPVTEEEYAMDPSLLMEEGTDIHEYCK